MLRKSSNPCQCGGTVPVPGEWMSIDGWEYEYLANGIHVSGVPGYFGQ